MKKKRERKRMYRFYRYCRTSLVALWYVREAGAVLDL